MFKQKQQQQKKNTSSFCWAVSSPVLLMDANYICLSCAMPSMLTTVLLPLPLPVGLSKLIFVYVKQTVVSATVHSSCIRQGFLIRKAVSGSWKLLEWMFLHNESVAAQHMKIPLQHPKQRNCKGPISWDQNQHICWFSQNPRLAWCQYWFFCKNRVLLSQWAFNLDANIMFVFFKK